MTILPLTQVLLAFSHLRLEGVVLVPRASGDTPRFSGDDGDTMGARTIEEVWFGKWRPTWLTVELPSSPHESVLDALEFDLSVPAFDFMESDEEDESPLFR